MNGEDLRDAIYSANGSLCPGSLSFWGDWFGRPYDNIHRIVGADLLDGAAIIYFDHAEILIIDAPQDWSLDGGKLVVRDARRVRFQWFCYGEVPGPDTWFFVECQRLAGELSFTTDFQPATVH